MRVIFVNVVGYDSMKGLDTLLRKILFFSHDLTNKTLGFVKNMCS